MNTLSVENAKQKGQRKKSDKTVKKIAVIDLETDPFQYGRDPKPFAAEFLSADRNVQFWGDDCVTHLLNFMEDIDESYLIYAHNGGKFDYMFMLDRLENPIKLINGRIAKAHIGKHELRDSYSIIPIPLAAYKKDEFNYPLMERDVRENNKVAILEYLHNDCVYLFDLVSAFNNRFGDKLTVGGTAIAELKKVHEVESTGEYFDTLFRPFYYGGRVECFRQGISEGKYKVIDVNSMYPYVMANFDHPNGSEFLEVDNPEIDENGELIGYENETYFAIIHADNDGALPWRTKNGLSFSQPFAEFYASSHEIKTALKYNRLKIRKVVTAYAFMDSIRFTEYVDKFSKEKIEAKASGDKIAELFAKFMLNSAYGKFGQNPDNFFDYHITKNLDEQSFIMDQFDVTFDGEEIPIWEMFEMHGEFIIWRKPVEAKMYYNVAIAASITGAARAVLLDAICKADTPFYCDTDSLIIEGDLPDIDLHDSRLGAWKLEAEGDTVAIAGKKVYALMEGKKCVKLASKGAKLTHQDIFHICRGNSVVWKSDAPNFKIDGSVKYVQRSIRQT